MSVSLVLQEFIHKIGFAVSLDGLNAYEKSLQRVDEKMESMYSGANKLLGRLETMGKQLSMKLTLPITALAGVSIAARVKQEEMQRSWGVLLGNMGEGIEFTKKMRELSEHTQFDHDQIDQYGKSLKQLQVPTKEIIPMIKRFADIAAGTGQDAGEMMSEYAMARHDPYIRGRILQRLYKQGVISGQDLSKAGVNPLIARKEGGLGMLGMGSLDKIFNELALKNMGKSAQLADQLGKNFHNFWGGLTRIRAAIGAMIEKVGHLNGFLKLGTGIFGKFADSIDGASPLIKHLAVGVGAFLAILGPGFLVIAGFTKSLLEIKKVITMISLNPLILEISLMVAGLVAVLVLMRAIGIANKYKKEADAINSKNTDISKENMDKLHNALAKKVESGEMTQAEADKREQAIINSLASNPNQKNVVSSGLGGSFESKKQIPLLTTLVSPLINRMRGFAGDMGTHTNSPSPIVIHNNTDIHLPQGSTAEHARILSSMHKDIVDTVFKKAVFQINNAKQ